MKIKLNKKIKNYEIEHSIKKNVLKIKVYSLVDAPAEWNFCITEKIDVIDFLKFLDFDVDYKPMSVDYIDRTSDTINKFYIENIECDFSDIKELITEKLIKEYLTKKEII